MYIEEQTMYIQEAFWDFNALVEVKHDVIPMKWVTTELDLNADDIEFLAFDTTFGQFTAIQ
jgi:hypothetical protein